MHHTRVLRSLHKEIIIFVVICVALGYLLSRQLLVAKKTQAIKKGEEEQLIALETARLIKANADLRLEIQELGTTASKYRESFKNRSEAEEEVSKNLERYKIIAGVTRIEGEGVEIRIEGGVSRENMVDLVNALKNIGVEGISINGRRLTISSYFTSNSQGLFLNQVKLEKPFLFQVVGNSALVKEALERRGGIIEQIEAERKDVKIKVEKKERLILEPAA